MNTSPIVSDEMHSYVQLQEHRRDALIRFVKTKNSSATNLVSRSILRRLVRNIIEMYIAKPVGEADRFSRNLSSNAAARSCGLCACPL